MWLNLLQLQEVKFIVWLVVIWREHFFCEEQKVYFLYPLHFDMCELKRRQLFLSVSAKPASVTVATSPSWKI